MTIQTLIEKYVEHNHLRYVKGDSSDISPMMPFFIMDIGYQYYCHDIKALPKRQELKRMAKRWNESYLAFNRRILTTFTDNDERIFLGDLTDELHAAIGNELMMTQVAAMNLFATRYDFAQQKVLSSVLMTNRLARISQNYWQTLYAGKDCPEINGVMMWSSEFSSYYLGEVGNEDVTVSDGMIQALDKCTEALVRKMSGWLKEQNGKKD